MAGQTEDRLIKVEKIGGFAGFGASSHLRSEGEVDLDRLPEQERIAIERLLKERPASLASSPSRDSFRYRLSWTEDGEHHSVEIDEGEAPESVRSAAKDKLI